MKKGKKKKKRTYTDIRPIYSILSYLYCILSPLLLTHTSLHLLCLVSPPIAWPFQEKVPAHDDTSKCSISVH